MTFGNLKQVVISCIAISIAASAPSAIMAQDLQIDTKALETTTKKPSAKKSKDTSLTSDPSSLSTERKAGGPDRQFGELEGWSPGKEPPKDPKDPNNNTNNTKTTPATGGTKLSTTPGGNMGVGFGF